MSRKASAAGCAFVVSLGACYVGRDGCVVAEDDEPHTPAGSAFFVLAHGATCAGDVRTGFVDGEDGTTIISVAADTYGCSTAWRLSACAPDVELDTLDVIVADVSAAPSDVCGLTSIRSQSPDGTETVAVAGLVTLTFDPCRGVVTGEVDAIPERLSGTFTSPWNTAESGVTGDCVD